MGPVCQISEIRTEVFASNEREVWFLWGLSRGKHGLPTAKILVSPSCLIPQRVQC